MGIVQVLVELWLFLAVVATFAWIGLVEVCQWRARRRERRYLAAVAAAERAVIAEAEAAAWESAMEHFGRPAA